MRMFFKTAIVKSALDRISITQKVLYGKTHIRMSNQNDQSFTLFINTQRSHQKQCHSHPVTLSCTLGSKRVALFSGASRTIVRWEYLVGLFSFLSLPLFTGIVWFETSAEVYALPEKYCAI